MKTVKEILEVYKPKAPDEQRFVDKHVTIKHKDRNGNGDDVFKADNVKTIKRKEERHGYDSGEDEKVYEEVNKVHSTYADSRPRGTGYLYSISHDGQITSSGNYRHNKKFKTPEKAAEYLERQGFTKHIREALEPLDEATVHYKHYILKSSPRIAGNPEAGDITRVQGHTRKMGKLDVEHLADHDYGNTRHISVMNTRTGERSNHHVYQSGNINGKPVVSIRSAGRNISPTATKHANVLSHYISGKIKLKESALGLKLANKRLNKEDLEESISAEIAELRRKKNATSSPIARANIESQIKRLERQQSKTVSEEIEELEESVQVVKKNYNWGRMVTIHDGAHQSFPLHPEHQQAIAGLSKGEKTSFKDETGATVHAERTGNLVHLKKHDTNRSVSVGFHHFKEDLEIDNRVDSIIEELKTLDSDELLAIAEALLEEMGEDGQ